MNKVVGSLVVIAAIHNSLYAGNDIKTVEPVAEIAEVEVSDFTHYSLGLKGGTLGVGLDLSLPVADFLNVRFNVNGLTYNHDMTDDDIDYAVETDFLTAGVLLDYYPIVDSGFRLSAGAYYNGNEVTGVAKLGSDDTYDIDGTEYTSAEIDSLSMTTDIDNFSPYVGIGWGSEVSPSGWSFAFDLGVLYQGATSVNSDLKYGTAPLSDAEKAVIQVDIDAETESLNNDINDYKYYPVIMIGASYAF